MINKYKLILFFTLLLQLKSNGQCVSNQSHSITPLGPYSPGQIVTVNYTLGNFIQLNVNWVHAFQINLSSGWINLTPIIQPGNPIGSLGSWTWDLQHTFPSGLNFGPGWRFTNLSVIDWGTSSNGPFNMSFTIEVAQTCQLDSLSIDINVYGDCLTGGWNNGACCLDPPYTIYNGVVQVIPVSTSNINHY